MKKLKLLIVIVTYFTSTAPQSHAWGEQGHHAICEAATRLVREPALKKFLQSRMHVMGHVCNIPDIAWRGTQLQPKESESSHFFAPDRIGVSLIDVPTEYPAWKALVESKEGSQSQPEIKIGSLWWRAEQFERLAKASLNNALKAQNASPVDKTVMNDAIYDAIINLALLGHFVGDASMPYHVTADFDGYATGHGGIHSYFESKCVAELPLDLPEKVRAKAAEMGDPCPSSQGVIERIRCISLRSSIRVKEIEALDPVFEVSVPESTNTPAKPAKRDLAEKGAKLFEEIIIQQLADSAAVLAELWDEAYIEAGRPNLETYSSYRYPLSPAFVPLDYL